MPELCRLDIGRGPALYEEIGRELSRLAEELRSRFHASRVAVFGSFVRHDLHQGSDIDLLVIGSFPMRFHLRPALVRELSTFPIEPICYTPEEFDDLVAGGNPFLLEILEECRDL
ncbi:MAG: nucleotidyltransferase domain-containing protein [Methanolinea sp.]|jgi:hypothetical protein|nr:nucleotidyltransferase domain-containing protein [Methanolinea sp.]